MKAQDFERTFREVKISLLGGEHPCELKFPLGRGTQDEGRRIQVCFFTPIFRLLSEGASLMRRFVDGGSGEQPSEWQFFASFWRANFQVIRFLSG